MPRRTLRQGLDRDVYHVIRKIKDSSDANSRVTISSAYETIKKSNSNLSRQKRQILEASIERVLQFISDESSDSEEEQEEGQEAAPKKARQLKHCGVDERLTGLQPEDRFLLNKQLTKAWSIAPATAVPKMPSSSETQPTKKRRLSNEAAPAPGHDSKPAPNGLAADQSQTLPASTKRTQRSRQYVLAAPGEIQKLGGLSSIWKQLFEAVFWVQTSSSTGIYHQDPRRPAFSGVLLSGPVGVGKKCLVEAMAKEYHRPLISLSDCFTDARAAPDRVEKIMSDAFDEAKRLAPSLLYLPETDKYLGKPSSSHPDLQEGTLISRFRRHMKAVAQWNRQNPPVLLIGTTHSLESVNSDVLSIGEFGYIIRVPAPGFAEREEILRILMLDIDPLGEFDYEDLCRLTHGFVGSDIASAVDAARAKATEREIQRSTRTIHLSLGASKDELNHLTKEHFLVWRDVSELGDAPFDGDRDLKREPVVEQDVREAIKSHVPYMRREGFTPVPTTTWDMVGAMSTIREGLQDAILGPIKNPELYAGFGRERPQNILLWGPPGCGKTLIAKAVANDANASFVLINGPELMNKYVGESERAIRELFSRARACTPCLFLFDEIDSLTPRRENSSTEASTRIVNALLTELDGAVSRAGVYVIGTTNRPDMMDPAMLRPGRFDHMLFVDLPTPEERVEILQTIYRSRARDIVNEDVEALAPVARDDRCRDFSGADLMGLFERAATLAINRYLAKGGAMKIQGPEWERALAVTHTSVKDPELYRELKRHL